MSSYGLMDIGFGRQVKFGTQWLLDNPDPAYRQRVNDILSEMALVVFAKSQLFITEFNSLNLIVGRPFPGSMIPRFDRIRDLWIMNNPPLNTEELRALQNIINSFLRIGILSEIFTRPPILNPIGLINENNELKIWPDFSNPNKLVYYYGVRNSIFKRNIFAFPQSTVFSHLVIKDAYYQIGLDQDSKMVTCFSLPYENGLRYFHFNTLHANLRNSDFAVQERISQVLDGLPIEFVRCICENIFIHTLDFDSHNFYLRLVLERCAQNSVLLCLNETKFLVKKIEILIFGIDERGISVGESTRIKISTIDFSILENREWFNKTCKIFRDLFNNREFTKARQFLKESNYRRRNKWMGHANFCKAFILNFQTVPLMRRV